MIWRLDLQIVELAHRFGVGWAVVTAACLLVMLFARLSRAIVVGMAVLLVSLAWYHPLIALSHVLRWWVFGILAVRGLLFVASVRGEGGGRERPPWSLIALGLFALISCAWSEAPLFSLLIACTFVCTLVLSYVVGWRLLDSDDFLPRLCIGALLVGVAMHVVGVGFGAAALLTRDFQLVHETGVDTRFCGVLSNANGNGVFGAMLWPIVLAAPATYLGRVAFLRWPVLVCLAISIVFSGSRTAVGIALMSTVVVFLYRYRAGAVVATGAVFVIGALALLATPVEEIEGSTVDDVVLRSNTLADVGGRLERWQRGWDVAMESPVFGHGWAHSRALDDQDTEQSLALGRVRYATNLHSAHVSLLVDVGFVGLGLFWIFGAQTIVAGVRLLAAPRSPEATVSMLFFASVLGMLADTFVHGGVLSAGSPNALIFWVSSAIVSKQSQRLASPAAEAAAAADEPVPGFRAAFS